MLESVQEQIVAITSLFSLMTALVFYVLKKQVYTSIYITIMSLASIYLTVYNMNCVLGGQCTAWSWILTLLIAGMAIISVFMYGRLIELQMKGQLANNEAEPLSRRVRVINAGQEY